MVKNTRPLSSAMRNALRLWWMSANYKRSAYPGVSIATVEALRILGYLEGSGGGHGFVKDECVMRTAAFVCCLIAVAATSPDTGLFFLIAAVFLFALAA